MRVFCIKSLVASLVVCSAVAANAQQPPYLAGLVTAPSAPVAAAPSDREAFLTADVKKSFPRLGERFTVLARSTKDYNAYSFVLGITDRWLQPETGTSENPFAGMDKFLAQGGYRRLPTFDLNSRPGTQKVAVYGTLQPDGDIAQITHAALQGADGKWSCKTGGLPVIQIDDLSQLRGPTYGLPVAVYERSVPTTPTTPVVPTTPTYPVAPVRY
jgi:type VI secretion system secreted protein VgrG